MDTTVGSVLILLLSLCAVIGNLAVFVWRCKKGNNERCSILSMMIVHLAFFDFLCGAYYVYDAGLALANIPNITNGTVSSTDDDMWIKIPLVVYLASFYTSGWVTLSIAVYSLAVIIPWKRRTTQIIAVISFLLAWMVFASTVTANILIVSSEWKLLYSGNKTIRRGNVLRTFYTISETRYLFVCECLDVVFVTITIGLYLLAVLPRVRRWRNMNRSSGGQSLIGGLRGRLLAIVIVNLLCTLLLICYLSSCWDVLVEDENSTKNIGDCPLDIIYPALIMMVPPASNPILYTVGTPKFLQLFSSLKDCLPRCQFIYRARKEQEHRSLLAEPHLCTACCVVCYRRKKERQSLSSESVQTSKLFTESSKRKVTELSFGFSSSSEEG